MAVGPLLNMTPATTYAHKSLGRHGTASVSRILRALSRRFLVLGAPRGHTKILACVSHIQEREWRGDLAPGNGTIPASRSVGL